VISALAGDRVTARSGFEEALSSHEACHAARENLKVLTDSPAPGDVRATIQPAAESAAAQSVKVAILSLLFNWPSTGGGTVHTAETATFLSQAGFDVRHFYARHSDWQVGCVEEELPYPGQPIEFDASTWNAADIQGLFRTAVDEFRPDYVIITDSWNFKPVLAEAMRGYRYLLRLAAQECLCPLNNVRLLVDDDRIRQCPHHQLVTPGTCQRCVRDRGHASGGLHQAERALSGFGTEQYMRRLRSAFAEAEAVLVVNPLIQALVSPYAGRTLVVPSGFDPQRFPRIRPEGDSPPTSRDRATLMFAGLVEEYMKGFRVLRAACELLWEKRRDFELVVTAARVGEPAPFVRCVGWLSQQELPRHLRAADVVVVPTVAQEALGRTAVEAMGAGRPVVASRLGGLPFVVSDGVTGRLFEPGNAQDLARQIEVLLDDPRMRERMGEAGRQRFEQRFDWAAVIERHYRPLLRPLPREHVLGTCLKS